MLTSTLRKRRHMTCLRRQSPDQCTTLYLRRRVAIRRCMLRRQPAAWRSFLRRRPSCVATSSLTSTGCSKRILFVVDVSAVLHRRRTSQTIAEKHWHGEPNRPNWLSKQTRLYRLFATVSLHLILSRYYWPVVQHGNHVFGICQMRIIVQASIAQEFLANVSKLCGLSMTRIYVVAVQSRLTYTNVRHAGFYVVIFILVDVVADDDSCSGCWYDFINR